MPQVRALVIQKLAVWDSAQWTPLRFRGGVKGFGGDDYELGGDGWRFGQVTELHRYMSYRGQAIER